MEAEAGAVRKAELAAEVSDKQLSALLKAVSCLQQVSLTALSTAAYIVLLQAPCQSAQLFHCVKCAHVQAP